MNTHVDPDLLAELEARGLVAQTTGGGELETHLREPRTLYCGFDPTADSLHIGSLVPLLALRRFQQAGHRPIAVVGGATGLIGDPSFKAQERKLNTDDVVRGWVERLTRQISGFVDFDGPNPAQVVNNLDWTAELSALAFLRDVGKHFSVNNMVNKESVKQRLAREGAGLSYTEFSYMLLQSMDFAELYHRYGCTLQIGGSDQWGNITGGVDLARRLHGGAVYGLTLPLITKSDGTKFGKTETGTIWLDAQRTSPYAFYQFWLGTADADVYHFLRYFTFLSPAEIAGIEETDRAGSGRPAAQGILAREVTRLVHGAEGLAAAERISSALFSGELAALTAEDFAQLQLDGLPHTVLNAEQLQQSLAECLVSGGMVASGKQVKDALSRGALLINGRPLPQAAASRLGDSLRDAEVLHGRYYLVKLGKKNHHLLVADQV